MIFPVVEFPNEIKALQALHDAPPLRLHEAKLSGTISYRVDMISILKITKGNNFAKRYNFHTNHIQNYKGT